MAKISVVINTLNEEKNLSRALSSIRDFADEIVVCDMYSDDKTLEIAKKFGARIYKHERTDYVEPARNFAVSEATGDWILVLDADEELSKTLADKFRRTVDEDKVDFISLPRKNIIFGKWIEHSRWWPDYVIRFFKKGKVEWSNKIHCPPKTEGGGLQLEATEENAIIHYNYTSVSQYIERLNRYTTIQSEHLLEDNYKFSLTDLIRKPTNEFLSRFFAGEGYKDGLHGLALAALQAFSEFVVYLKIWEKEGFKDKNIDGVFKEMERGMNDVKYWIVMQEKNPVKRILRKLRV